MYQRGVFKRLCFFEVMDMEACDKYMANTFLEFKVLHTNMFTSAQCAPDSKLDPYFCKHVLSHCSHCCCSLPATTWNSRKFTVVAGLTAAEPHGSVWYSLCCLHMLVMPQAAFSYLILWQWVSTKLSQLISSANMLPVTELPLWHVAQTLKFKNAGRISQHQI